MGCRSRQRKLQGQELVRTAFSHAKSNSLAFTRAELEKLRDHVDTGVPYLPQMIGLIADTQQDAAAKAEAAERLREFAPEFEGSLDFSPEAIAKATVGLAINFGLALQTQAV